MDSSFQNPDQSAKTEKSLFSQSLCGNWNGANEDTKADTEFIPLSKAEIVSDTMRLACVRVLAKGKELLAREGEFFSSMETDTQGKLEIRAGDAGARKLKDKR